MEGRLSTGKSEAAVFLILTEKLIFQSNIYNQIFIRRQSNGSQKYGEAGHQGE